MRKIGDVSRKRRLFGSQAQTQWYAWYRCLRFARRCSGIIGRPCAAGSLPIPAV